MKKKLEADLISIAHRILKLKNKSELIQLHQETQKLYEKLSVLLFVENHFQEVKPTIGLAKMQEDLATAFETFDSFDKNETSSESSTLKEITVEIPSSFGTQITPNIEPAVASEIEPIIEAETKLEETDFLDKVEPITQIEITPEEIRNPFDENNFLKKDDEAVEVKPNSEFFKEEITTESKDNKKEIRQISFEEILGSPIEPIFERVVKKEKTDEVKDENENETPSENKTILNEEIEALLSKIETKSAMESTTEHTTSLDEETEALLSKIETKSEVKPEIANDFSNNNKSISFGLNDRIAFEKHLFGGSSEDLNRVISQISTYDTLQEAHDFIEDMVKPDYNNWEGKEEYINRFMAVVENKFS